MIKEHVKALIKSQIAQKEEIIKKAIGISNYFIILNSEQISKRGQINIFPDGRELFIWDGKPIIEFYPPKYSFNGTILTVTQNYRYT